LGEGEGGVKKGVAKGQANFRAESDLCWMKKGIQEEKKKILAKGSSWAELRKKKGLQKRCLRIGSIKTTT